MLKLIPKLAPVTRSNARGMVRRINRRRRLAKRPLSLYIVDRPETQRDFLYDAVALVWAKDAAQALDLWRAELFGRETRSALGLDEPISGIARRVPLMAPAKAAVIPWKTIA